MKIENFDDYTIAKVLLAYLIEEKSHRWIQREILGMPAHPNGGGFVTMSVLHHFDIKFDKKGLLKNNLDDLKQINKHAIKIIENYIILKKEAENLVKRRSINPNNKDTDRYAHVKIRVYQEVLKKHVLENYENQCALCEIDQLELLVASHIIPWSTDKSKRLYLDNCILLCSFHDKLFDKGFITLDNNLNIIVSNKLSRNVLKLVNNLTFKNPIHDSPNILYLSTHRKKIFKK